MRLIPILLAVSLTGSLAAEEINKGSSGTEVAISRGIDFLVKDALQWKSDHQCVSCHHASLVIWAMYEAKLRHRKIDEPFLTEMTKWVAESGDGKTSVPRPASALGLGTSYHLLNSNSPIHHVLQV